MISTSLPKEVSSTTPFFDVILVSGEKWADHPHSGIGIISRVLEAAGFSVGIIEKPNWHTLADFTKLGMPKLFFGVSSGSIDSMLQNYTPLKKKRAEDPYHPFKSNIPDRATIVYAQKIRQAIKQNSSKVSSIHIVLGGVEASLRRFTHYDYWSNSLRKPIILDAKADILVYGPGEYQVVEIARRLVHKQPLWGIEGTVISFPQKKCLVDIDNFESLPSFEEIATNKERFCDMQLQFSNSKNLLQKTGNFMVLQYRMHNYTSDELDAIFSLPYSYHIPKNFSEFQMAQFSIITHRGCIGECSFCAIALHQGTKIVSRSQKNILEEIEKMTHLDGFRGYISDLGGPSANMYGMDCSNRESCMQHCMKCPFLDRSHKKALELLQKSREIPGIKKVFVRSGVRFDMIIDHDEYMRELFTHHISGQLKIAPEHFSPNICALMNKDNSRFEEFLQKFKQLNPDPKQSLKYYFITAHPGSTLKDVEFLHKKIRQLGEKSTESIQIFTPTPMSVSTCMYYTGLNPFTKEPVYVPYTYKEKKIQKNLLYSRISQHSLQSKQSQPSQYLQKSPKNRKKK